MAEEPLDENDPFYAFKKWGRDYRTKDAYWVWRHARDDKERTERETKKPRENVSAAQELAAYRAMGEW